MKLNKYTNFVTIDGGDYLFNLANERILYLVPELASLVKEHAGNITELSAIHPELYDAMVRDRMITPRDTDDTEAFVDEQLRDEAESRRFGMTINPTLDCNMRCWYCYEKRDASHMSADTLERIVRLIRNKAQSDDIDRLSVSFFGGEPLLYFKDTVYPILSRASEICRSEGVGLDSSFTTNAVLLTREVLDSINAIEGIGRAQFQITLDGNRFFHNRTRIYADRRPTFDIIFNNMRYALESGNRVGLRFNYTDKNIESFIDVYDELMKLPSELRKNLHCSFQQIWQNKQEGMMAKERATELTAKFQAAGLASECDSIYHRHVCYADRPDHVSINYNGDVFKCTARDYLPERREGVLREDGTIEWNQKYHDRMAIRFSNTACRKCRVMPLCNGHCTQDKLESLNKDRCYLNRSEADKDRLIHHRLYELVYKRIYVESE